MNTDIGRQIRDTIKNDSKLEKYIKESPDPIDYDEGLDRVHYTDEATLDVEAIGHHFDSLGDVFYGAKLKVPKGTNLDDLTRSLKRITREVTGDGEPVIWVDKTHGDWYVYVESEKILEQALEEAEENQSYTLRFEWGTKDGKLLSQ